MRFRSTVVRREFLKAVKVRTLTSASRKLSAVPEASEGEESDLIFDLSTLDAMRAACNRTTAFHNCSSRMRISHWMMATVEAAYSITMAAAEPWSNETSRPKS